MSLSHVDHKFKPCRYSGSSRLRGCLWSTSIFFRHLKDENHKQLSYVMAADDLRHGCLWSACSSEVCTKLFFLQFTELGCLWSTSCLLMSYNGCSWATFFWTRLLLSYFWPLWGSRNLNISDIIGIFDLPFWSAFWSPTIFWATSVRVFTSRVALNIFHGVAIVVVFYSGWCVFVVLVTSFVFLFF